MLGYAGEVLPLLVLADTFGITQQFTKYLPYDSKYIRFQEWETSQHPEMRVCDMIKTEIKDFCHLLCI